MAHSIRFGFPSWLIVFVVAASVFRRGCFFRRG